MRMLLEQGTRTASRGGDHAMTVDCASLGPLLLCDAPEHRVWSRPQRAHGSQVR
jgi:hypothetical protein